jgi:hypothetical protein
MMQVQHEDKRCTNPASAPCSVWYVAPTTSAFDRPGPPHPTAQLYSSAPPSPPAPSFSRFDTAGVSIIDFPDGPGTPAPGGGAGVLRCLNYTAHLGRWAAPISRDDLDGVCGIDGCF